MAEMWGDRNSVQNYKSPHSKHKLPDGGLGISLSFGIMGKSQDMSMVRLNSRAHTKPA